MSDEKFFYILSNGDVLLADGARLPRLEEGEAIGNCFVRSGTIDTSGDRWAELDGSRAVPDGFSIVGLREVAGLLGYDSFVRCGLAAQLVNWMSTNQFCGRCGSPTRDHPIDRARECPICGNLAYPTLSPAVIMAIIRDGKLLLASNKKFPSGRMSVLAGFVEPGETLEGAVRREVREEVSIEIKNIRYFGSQPWPFPHSLMVGFTAEWESGELSPDGEEIVDAGWFTPDELPDIPPSISISRRLIDNWLSEANRR